VQQTEQGWKAAGEEFYVDNLSQEHGIMEQAGDLIRQVSIGENLLFLPVHSCLTANLAAEYWIQGKERITNIHSF
jgi:D-serine deaminase-like pyridoxal phosphate-dependent protein